METKALKNNKGRFANHVDMTNVDLRTLPEVFRTVRNQPVSGSGGGVIASVSVGGGGTILEHAVRMEVPFKLEYPTVGRYNHKQVIGIARQVGEPGDFLVQAQRGEKYIVSKSDSGRYALLEYHMDLEKSMRTVAQIGRDIEKVIELLPSLRPISYGQR